VVGGSMFKNSSLKFPILASQNASFSIFSLNLQKQSLKKIKLKVFNSNISIINHISIPNSTHNSKSFKCFPYNLNFGYFISN